MMSLSKLNETELIQRMERLKSEANKKKRQKKFQEADLKIAEQVSTPVVGVVTRSKSKLASQQSSPVKEIPVVQMVPPSSTSKTLATSPKPKQNLWVKKAFAQPD